MSYAQRSIVKVFKKSSISFASLTNTTLSGDLLKTPYPRLRRFPFKVAAGLESGRYRRLETTPALPIPPPRRSPLSRAPVPQHCNWRTREPGYRGVAKKGKRAGSRSRRGPVEDALIQDGWVLCVYQRGCRRPRKYPDVMGPRVSHVYPSRKYFT